MGILTAENGPCALLGRHLVPGENQRHQVAQGAAAGQHAARTFRTGEALTEPAHQLLFEQSQ